MGQAVRKQHPAVVLRSQYTLLRALLATAMIAVVGLTVAVVIVANDENQVRDVSSARPIESINSVPQRRLDGATNRTRYDGGPEEGTRGIVPPSAPVARYDGGPEEGAADVNSSGRPTSRYDGGPEEGSRGPGH